MPDRHDLLIALAALILVCAVMASLHQRHYDDRKLQLLRYRVDGLEAIILGDHTV